MTALVRYEAAREALAEARTVDEIRDIADKAAAMLAYARRAKDKTLEVDAREIRWRSERRLGQIICAMPKARGGAAYHHAQTGVIFTPVVATLEALGVDKNLARRARTCAKLPEEHFEALCKQAREFALSEDGYTPLDVLATENKAARRARARADYDSRRIDGCNIDDLDALADAGSKFAAISADPNWQYRTWSRKGQDRSPESHYQTDPLATIKTFPVNRLAAADCALFLWVVDWLLPGALEVIESWGFRFIKVGFVWIKQNPSGEGRFLGLGKWTREGTELCLLATRGNPKRLNADVRQVIEAPVREHSVKPDEIHGRIERLVDGPYLELYGRRPRADWTVWGDEIPRSQLHLPPTANNSHSAPLDIPDFLLRNSDGSFMHPERWPCP